MKAFVQRHQRKGESRLLLLTSWTCQVDTSNSGEFPTIHPQHIHDTPSHQPHKMPSRTHENPDRGDDKRGEFGAFRRRLGRCWSAPTADAGGNRTVWLLGVGGVQGFLEVVSLGVRVASPPGCARLLRDRLRMSIDLRMSIVSCVPSGGV